MNNEVDTHHHLAQWKKKGNEVKKRDTRRGKERVGWGVGCTQILQQMLLGQFDTQA